MAAMANRPAAMVAAGEPVVQATSAGQAETEGVAGKVVPAAMVAMVAMVQPDAPERKS